MGRTDVAPSEGSSVGETHGWTSAHPGCRLLVLIDGLDAFCPGSEAAYLVRYLYGSFRRGDPVGAS